MSASSFLSCHKERRIITCHRNAKLCRPHWKLHRNSRKQDLPVSHTCRCTWSRCLGKKKGERLILQSPPYPCNYPLGQLNLPENKVKHYTCTESAGVIDNDSDRNSRAFMFMLNCTRPATNENHWRIGCSQGTMNSCERWSMCVFVIFAYMCACSSITLLSINYILQGTWHFLTDLNTK